MWEGRSRLERLEGEIQVCGCHHWGREGTEKELFKVRFLQKSASLPMPCVVLQGQWCFKDKGRPCLKKCQRHSHTPYRTLNRPPHHVAMVTKFLSPPGRCPPGQRDLSQIRKGICPLPLPPYRRKVYVPRQISKQNFHLGPFLCFLAIKTDQ